MSYRLHVVSLPHTETIREYASCAYTEKVRKFCTMMHVAGHEVILYAGPRNEAGCTEHVVVASAGMIQLAQAKVAHYTQCSFDDSVAPWPKFIYACIHELEKRLQPRDVICFIGGWPQRKIAEAFPNHLCVEFGIGYAGTFAKFRIFESYAWMHAVYGHQAAQGRLMSTQGNSFDEVIPGFFDPADFEMREEPQRENYVLYLGRVTELKGVQVAVEATKRAGVPLVIAGPGDWKPYLQEHVTYVGEAGPEQRNVLLHRARALIAPTLYLEPFGNVVIEAMACGTPVITSDWGAFTETVKDDGGIASTGFRCRMLRDYVKAIGEAHTLSHHHIKLHAVRNYSTAAVQPYFTKYFDRLATLWNEQDNGWYAR